jgi:hypothetical protein
MNDLSNSSDLNVPTPAQPVISVTPSGNKEAQGGGIEIPESLRDSTGQEFELPKEVAGAGVKVHPTVVAIPPPVSQMGVKPVGQNVPVQTSPTVVLPLTDEQIATGLHQGVADSIRWLSEWCVRRLKHLHIAVKVVHGKLIRTASS